MKIVAEIVNLLLYKYIILPLTLHTAQSKHRQWRFQALFCWPFLPGPAESLFFWCEGSVTVQPSLQQLWDKPTTQSYFFSDCWVLLSNIELSGWVVTNPRVFTDHFWFCQACSENLFQKNRNNPKSDYFCRINFAEINSINEDSVFLTRQSKVPPLQKCPKQ